MMKNKKVILGVVWALAGVAAIAETLSYGTFSGTGTAGATAIVKQAAGVPVCLSMNSDIATGATFVVHRADRSTTANNPLSGSTNLIVRTDTAGKVLGHLPTTSDSIIISSTASGYVYRAITAVDTTGVSTNSYITLTFSGATSCSTNDPVYLAIAGNQQSIVMGSGTKNGLAYMFSGYDRNPVAVVVPASAGQTTISGLIGYDGLGR